MGRSVFPPGDSKRRLSCPSRRRWQLVPRPQPATPRRSRISWSRCYCGLRDHHRAGSEDSCVAAALGARLHFRCFEEASRSDDHLGEEQQWARLPRRFCPSQQVIVKPRRPSASGLDPAQVSDASAVDWPAPVGNRSSTGTRLRT